MPNNFSELQQLLAENPQWALWMGGISLATFLLSLILIPWLIIKLPENYFSDRKRHTSRLRQRHPLEYALILTAKNLLAVFLIIAGLLMLVLPGQGLLSLLIGISLSDFPGKFRLERWIVSRPGVLATLNWIRKKARKPELKL